VHQLAKNRDGALAAVNDMAVVYTLQVSNDTVLIPE
jgi:hypothetical protein